jgi:hypothetical protein
MTHLPGRLLVLGRGDLDVRSGIFGAVPLGGLTPPGQRVEPDHEDASVRMAGAFLLKDVHGLVIKRSPTTRGRVIGNPYSLCPPMSHVGVCPA